LRSTKSLPTRHHPTRHHCFQFHLNHFFCHLSADDVSFPTGSVLRHIQACIGGTTTPHYKPEPADPNA
jgi:hypothetical protein